MANFSPKRRRSSVSFVIPIPVGGVIGDAAGLLLRPISEVSRGLASLRLLIAQIDSGIGGKTRSNTASGKNLVGAFHQPALVICSADIPKKTLPMRERISGLGEMVKYGLIFRPQVL